MRAVLLLLAMALQFPVAGAETIKVMAYNLRYAGGDRSPNSWPERRPLMKECVLASAPDIIGTQEGLYRQILDLENDLEGYRWIGLGREGGSRGEFMAVFYKPERFDPLEYDHFWLSDTPNIIASATWGNTVRRMVTWIRFKDKATDREFYLVNTHFDHQVQAAREKSAELLLQRVKELKGNLPVIITGDFNAKAGANKAYEILTADGYLVDTWHDAKERRGEPVATFNSFRRITPGDNRIDWILARGVETVWTEINTCRDGDRFPSDHFPVIAEVKLN